jgi:hypothetical protein
VSLVVYERVFDKERQSEVCAKMIPPEKENMHQVRARDMKKVFLIEIIIRKIAVLTKRRRVLNGQKPPFGCLT